MEIEYDPAKRDQVLAERGFDLARCGESFEDFHLTRATTSTVKMKCALPLSECLMTKWSSLCGR